MTTILSRKDLSSQTDTHVYVTRSRMLYVRVDAEYVPKKYFTSKEVQGVLKITAFEMHRISRKLGITFNGRKARFTIHQLRRMAESR